MKKKIAILAGGNSSERAISLNSAKQISESIDTELFESFLIDIDRNSWQYVNEKNRYDINKNNFTVTVDQEYIRFDCALIMIHGTPGEDGKLQAYCEMMDVPYTTCDVLTSALTFNKYFCNRYLNNFGILTAKSIYYLRGQDLTLEEVQEKVGFPCFIKPNNGGSSCGISRVNNPDALFPALEKALLEDNEVLIEEYISGREFTCGLMVGKSVKYELPVCEVVSKNEFFDYDAKYTEGKAEEIIPAHISGEWTQKIQKLSVEIYKTLKCRGVVRIDYILGKNQLYFLEVNTIPGMSKNSIVPKMLRNAGFSLGQFITDLIYETMELNKISVPD